MNNKSTIIFFIMMIILLSGSNSFCFTLKIRHFYHLFIQPKDLYEPIIEDRFPFHEKGFSKIYKLKPKYFDYYNLGISFEKNNISYKYKFNGKLLVEFFYRQKLISSSTVNKIIAGWPAEKDGSKYRKIALLNFPIPINKKYKKDISLKITVLEVDEVLKKHKNSLRLFVAVSSIP